MNDPFWLDTAQEARDAALLRIAEHNLTAALDQLHEIDAQTRRLTKHPHLGRPGRRPGTRELSINRTPFIVTYRIVGENIQILHFRHSRSSDYFSSSG